jgi:hypothetical protein
MDCSIISSLLPVSIQTTIINVATPALVAVGAVLFWLVMWCISAIKQKTSALAVGDDPAPTLRYGP